MIINVFIQNDKYRLDYNKLEKYTSTVLFVVSLITIFNLYFDYNYSLNVIILKYYLFIELLFLPWYKRDIIFHHIITIGIISYIQYYNINMITNFYSTKQLLLTEISSVFLSINSLIKLYNIPNVFGIRKLLQQISMVCFIVTFIKYRIYDYYNNVIVNDYFYQSIKSNDSNFQYMCKYSLTYLLFSINLYWFVLIIKKLYKSIFDFSMLYAEYILQYSYFGCLLSTCTTYAIVATPFQKEYYSNYISLDVASNFLLSLTSYEFHKHIYDNLLLDENMNRATVDYKYYLLQDIIIIQGRSLIQVYCHFNIHNIFDTYKYIFYFQLFYSIILCFIVDAVYYSMIVNKRNFSINEINTTSRCLDLLFGSNAFFCIIISSFGVYGTEHAINNIICLYVLSLITIIKPFYKINHLLIHVMMIFQNYFLVRNNLYLKN
jgi:hypothetical protein